MATKKSAAFDFNKYVIGRETEIRTLTIPESKESFDVSVKPLSWAKLGFEIKISFFILAFSYTIVLYL